MSVSELSSAGRAGTGDTSPVPRSTTEAPGDPAVSPGVADASSVSFLRQVPLLITAALLYFGVRGLTEANRDLAVRHARSLIGLERSLHLDVEGRVQRLVLEHHSLVTLANWIYIWGHWPVIATTFVWLYRSDPATYRVLRNAMFVSGAVGLVIFAMYPVAPPRLAGTGFVDTVTELSHSYRVLQPPALVNKYAALPSLHVGWNFLVGVFVWRHGASPLMRIVGIASPMLMVVAVVLTANHYLIDAVAGVAIAAAGLYIATRADAVADRSKSDTPASPAVRSTRTDAAGV